MKEQSNAAEQQQSLHSEFTRLQLEKYHLQQGADKEKDELARKAVELDDLQRKVATININMNK